MRYDFSQQRLLKELQNRGIQIPYHPNAPKPKGKVNYMLLGFGHYLPMEAEVAAKEMQNILAFLP